MFKHLLKHPFNNALAKSACLFLSTALIALPVMAEEWAFDVYLDKSKIGKHTFTLDQNRQLTSRAKFNVKVLFIEAYNYDHTAKEQWKDDCLASLEANTTENKVVSNIKGAKKDAGFEVSDGKTTQTLPTCTMTFAYWNPKILTQSKLLNPQNAEYLDTNFEKLGQETITVKGQPAEVTHYKLKGSLNGKNKLNIELWYNAKNEWVALKSITPEGYKINYKLI
ncbi:MULTISPECIES: DUF6134 family protein [Methylotenera]|uniref:DUF6134 family protein n=1 Tax=Methylotenera TaxID=359407 RepID=UPI0003782C18|nr:MULTISPECIES: DUF6134 family protein [Methylotenera]